MECPVCHLDQVIVEWGDVELDVCIDGHGIWFDTDELRHLFAAAGAPEAVVTFEERLKALPRGHGGPKRRCPRCGKKMRQVATPGHDQTVLDRCPHGHGLWFDDGELEQIIERELDDPDVERVRSYLIRFIRPEEGEKESEA